MPTIRTILILNALSCLVFGAVFLSVPGMVAGFLGTPPAPAALIAGLGAGLIAYSLPLLYQSRQAAPRPGWLWLFGISDGFWGIASLVLVLAELWITRPAGIAAALAVAAMVGSFGWLQLRQLWLKAD